MKSTLSRSFIRRSLTGGALILLAACGGGGDDSTPASEPAAATPTPASGATPPASAAAVTTINLTLSGAQEVPPNGSTATGTGEATIDTVSRQFTAKATTQGLAGTAAHVHDGPSGVSGPIVFPMTENPAGSGVWSTSVQLTDAQMATLNAGRYYINVHSAAFPNGEIRGQIVQQASPAVPVAEGGGGGGGGGGY